MVPKGQLQTADASAGTEIAAECGNFSSFLLEKSPDIALGKWGLLEV